jgi:hypothetical protein
MSLVLDAANAARQWPFGIPIASELWRAAACAPRRRRVSTSASEPRSEIVSMKHPQEIEPTEPKVLTQTLTSETPREQADEIAKAEHEYVRVHRQRPRFLVLHPEDHERLGPMIHKARAENPPPEAEEKPVVDRVHSGLDRGAIVFSDTDNPEWQEPRSRETG